METSAGSMCCVVNNKPSIELRTRNAINWCNRNRGVAFITEDTNLKKLESLERVENVIASCELLKQKDKDSRRIGFEQLVALTSTEYAKWHLRLTVGGLAALDILEESIRK
jgi:hypothetical protein